MKTYCRRKYKNERGVSLVLFSLSLIAIIGVTALTVDMGKTMYTKTKLKIATDAAALRGAQAILENPGDEVTARAEAEIAARLILKANLVAGGMNESKANTIATTGRITIDPLVGDPARVIVEADSAVNYSFLQLLPGFGDMGQTTTQSAAEIGRESTVINEVPTCFVLTLDKSGSMDWDLTDSDPPIKKIDALKNSIDTLLDMLTEDDEFGNPNSSLHQVTFNGFTTGCSESSPVYDLRQDDLTSENETLLEVNAARDWVDANMVPDSWTNVPCGTKDAYEKLRDTNTDVCVGNRVAILITDGVSNRGLPPGDECCEDPLGGAICYADKIKSELQVPFYTMGFGSDSHYDPAFLSRLAGDSEGDYDSYDPSNCSIAPGKGPQVRPDQDTGDGEGDFLPAPDEETLEDNFAKIIRESQVVGTNAYYFIPAPTE